MESIEKIKELYQKKIINSAQKERIILNVLTGNGSNKGQSLFGDVIKEHSGQTTQNREAKLNASKFARMEHA